MQNLKTSLLYEEAMLGLQYSVLPQHSSAALGMPCHSLYICCYKRGDGALVLGKNDCCEEKVIPCGKNTNTEMTERVLKSE